MNIGPRTIEILLSRYDELIRKEEKLNVIDKLVVQDYIGVQGILEIICEPEEKSKHE